jgi:RNA polymerase sigma factor (sigma-70 family)
VYDAAKMIEGLREKEPEAWEQFHDRFYKSVLAILSRRYPKLDKAGVIPDVVSDAFLQVIEQLRQGTRVDPAKFKTYVLRVALRAASRASHRRLKLWCNSPYRDEWREINPLDLSRVAVCPRPTPDIAYLLSHKAHLIKKGLDRLRPTDRDIIVRFYLAEQPKEEIMAAYGWNQSAFRMRKTQALQRLTAKVYGLPTSTSEKGRQVATFKELRGKGCTWAQ